jgi:hypothetical protein
MYASCVYSLLCHRRRQHKTVKIYGTEPSEIRTERKSASSQAKKKTLQLWGSELNTGSTAAEDLQFLRYGLRSAGALVFRVVISARYAGHSPMYPINQ